MKQTFPASLRFAPFPLEEERELFLRCYEDTWRIAHGSLDGFEPEGVFRAALIRGSVSPEATLGLWSGEEFLGLISFDERRGRREKLLWISFLYVTPEHRGEGLGRALIERAAERAWTLGRRELQLCTARGNPALEFYGALGFRVCGTEPGALEPLLKLRLIVAEK